MSGCHSGVDQVLQGQDCFRSKRWPSRFSALQSSGLDAVFGALRNQPAFKMCDGAKDVENQLTGSGRRVDPLFQADQSDILRFLVLYVFLDFLERSSKAFQPRVGKTVSRAGVVEQRAQSWTIKLLSRNDVLEPANSASFLQAGNLTGDVLVRG